MQKWIVFCFLVFILAACAPAPAPPVVVPTIPATVLAASSTSTLQPTASFTLSPVPTASATPSPRPTLTPSRIPTQMATFTPELWKTRLALTETIPAIILTDIPGHAPGYDWWHSPDGLWLAEDRLWSLRVISSDGKTEWTIDLSKLDVFRRYRTELLGWSLDNDYFYVSYRMGYMDGPGAGHCKTNGLVRLNLRSGEASPLLKFDDNPVNCWNYAFSNPPRMLAYIPPFYPQQLVALDLNSGEKLSSEIDPFFGATGDIYWSSDQKQILLIASRFDSEFETTDALFQFKIDNGELVRTEMGRWKRPFGEFYLSVEEWVGDRVLVTRGPKPLANVYLSSQIVIPVATSTPQPKP